MTIYIDNDFKCHTSPGDGFRAVEADFFEGKSKAYIEGYRFVPAGDTWTRADGVMFTGEMVSPWRPYDRLEELQTQHEVEEEAHMEELETMAETIDQLCAQILGETEEDL